LFYPYFTHTDVFLERRGFSGVYITKGGCEVYCGKKVNHIWRN